MSIEYTVVCDGCAEILEANRSAWEARKVVREQLGGIQRGAKDYCASCRRTILNTPANMEGGDA